MTITPEAIYTLVSILVAILYEVSARMIPTDKNYSLVHFIVTVLDKWLKNKNTQPNTVFTISKIVKVDEHEEKIST